MQKGTRYIGKQPITQGDQKSKLIEDMKRKAVETLRKDYQDVFNGMAGPEVAQRVLVDMLNYCMVNAMTMTGNTWTYFNEGRRDVGRRVKALIGPDLCAAYEKQMEVIVE